MPAGATVHRVPSSAAADPTQHTAATRRTASPMATAEGGAYILCTVVRGDGSWDKPLPSDGRRVAPKLWRDDSASVARSVARAPVQASAYRSSAAAPRCASSSLDSSSLSSGRSSSADRSSDRTSSGNACSSSSDGSSASPPRRRPTAGTPNKLSSKTAAAAPAPAPLSIPTPPQPSRPGPSRPSDGGEAAFDRDVGAAGSRDQAGQQRSMHDASSRQDQRAGQGQVRPHLALPTSPEQQRWSRRKTTSPTGASARLHALSEAAAAASSTLVPQVRLLLPTATASAAPCATTARLAPVTASPRASAPRMPSSSPRPTASVECLPRPALVPLGCCCADGAAAVWVSRQELRDCVRGLWNHIVTTGTVPFAACFMAVGQRWVPLCAEDLALELTVEEAARALPMLAEAAWRTLDAQDARSLTLAPMSAVMHQVLRWCRVLHGAIHGLNAAVVATRRLRKTPGFGWLSAKGELADVDASAATHLDALAATLGAIGTLYRRLPAPIAALLTRQRLLPLLCELLHCAKGPLCEFTFRLDPIFSRVLRLAQVMADTSPELLAQLQEPQRHASSNADLPSLRAALQSLVGRADAFVAAFAGALTAVGATPGVLPDRMRAVYGLVGGAATCLQTADAAVRAALRRNAAVMGGGGGTGHPTDSAAAASSGGDPAALTTSLDASRVEGVARNLVHWLRVRRGLPPSSAAPALPDVADTAGADKGGGGWHAEAAVAAVVRWVAVKAEGVHGEIPTAHDVSYLLGVSRQRLYDLEWRVCEQADWGLYREPPQPQHG